MYVVIAHGPCHNGRRARHPSTVGRTATRRSRDFGVRARTPAYVGATIRLSPGAPLQNSSHRATNVLGVPLALVVSMLAVVGVGAPAGAVPSPDLVISQVYGGGGNAGAPLNADFVELFNRGTAPAALDGMSVQYASATGTGNFGATGALVALPAVDVPAGGRFLVGMTRRRQRGRPARARRHRHDRHERHGRQGRPGHRRHLAGLQRIQPVVLGRAARPHRRPRGLRQRQLRRGLTRTDAVRHHLRPTHRRAASTPTATPPTSSPSRRRPAPRPARWRRAVPRPSTRRPRSRPTRSPSSTSPGAPPATSSSSTTTSPSPT